MKKILMTLLILSVVFSFTSCDKGFEKENTDPIGIISSPPEKLLAPALVNVLKTNLVRNRTFSNELMQVTVIMSDDQNAVSRYDFRPSFADYTWNGWYSELTNIRDIYDIASTPEYQNDSYKGISRILESWVFSLLTDSYGDVPFTEANQGKSGLVEPAFDSQKDIYKALFNKLEEANTLLSGSTAPVVVSSDPVYHGDINLWRKFGNSLYLRLLLRVSGKAEVSSEVIAKMKEILQDNPSKYPIFTTNEESAVLKWTGGTDVQNPFTNPYVMQYKEGDFPLVALAYYFMDKLNEWNDPRIDLSNKYGKNSRNRLGIAPGGNGLVGIESGYVPGTVDMRQSYFYSSSNSEFSIQKSPLTGILMTAAEVEFIKAEAIAKGWVSGSVSEHYYKGIANAINYWVPIFSTDINGTEFTDYITNAGLVWDDDLPLDAPNGDSEMERILVQKYFSLFITDFQQWFEYRRTGHPILPIGPGVQNGGKMPARLNYPTYIQSANPTNYSKAAANMGGDNINSLVWWQKP